MNTRALLVVAVVVMAALAGCGLGGDGGDATTTTTTTDDTATTTTTTTAEETTATTTTTAEETTATTTTTAGGGGTGDLPADAAEQHERALRDAGSFAVAQELSYTNETTSLLGSDIASELDLDAGRGYQNGSFSFGGFASVQSSYTDGDETWERQNSSFGGVQYSYGTAPYDASEPTPVNFTTVVGETVNATTSNVSYSRTGTTTVDGVEATVYEADGQQLLDELGFNASSGSFFGNATVQSASATVAIDDDGIIRLATFEIVLETEDAGRVTISFEQRVTDIGETTVEEPDWLDEAKAQTGANSNQ